MRRAARPCAAAPLLALAALLLGGAIAGTATRALAAARTGYAVVEPLCARPAPGTAGCLALRRRRVETGTGARARAPAPGARRYLAGAGAYSVGPAEGLTPEDLASAYSYDPAGGAGQTVAVIDAFDDPRIEADLATFDEHYGLGECTRRNGCFRKVSQTGSETELPSANTEGWAAEISLDVETVRSVCHGCSILLVEAASARWRDLAAAVGTAVRLGANEVSNSYGGPEVALPEIDAAYDHPGVVMTAASGDLGWDDWNYLLPPLREELAERGLPPPEAPDAPASLPGVVAVGGTTLQLTEAGAWAGERVWNESSSSGRVGFVTGGGCSHLFAAPPWQAATPGYAGAGCTGGRLSADVAADGDPMSGLDVYDGFDTKGHAGWQTFGGTSLSTPLVAAMYALAGGAGGASYPAVSLYGHVGQAALHDVVAGGNGLCDGEPASVCGHPGHALDCEGNAACDAGPGLDGPSGTGTPDGLAALSALRPVASIAAPSRVVAGSPASFTAAGSSDPYAGAGLNAWTWTWGDGTATSTEAAPAHTFALPGTYTVTLSVSDRYLVASLPASAQVQVLAPEPAPPAPRQAVSAFTSVRPPAHASLAAVRGIAVGANGRLTLRVLCSDGSGGCAGTILLRLPAAVAGVHGGLSVLASVRFHLAAGSSRTLTLKLSQRGRALLTRRRTLRVRLQLRPDGSPASSRLVTLRLKRPARR